MKSLRSFTILLAIFAAGVAQAISLTKPVAVRIVLSNSLIANRGGAGWGAKFYEITNGEASHLWIADVPSSQGGTATALLLQTTFSDQAATSETPQVFEGGKIGVAGLANHYGIPVIENVYKLAEAGLIKRVDLGLFDEGVLYVEALELVTGDVLNQAEISLTYRAARRGETGEQINLHFLQLLLGKEAGTRVLGRRFEKVRGVFADCDNPIVNFVAKSDYESALREALAQRLASKP
ncbi:MAG TPA: hypothetical protein VM901_06805 [Bdellovibrionota bacterium]|jgi:hypothetical protein|nr:hypothetical protein [Bdellovibrionota bacterium]